MGKVDLKMVGESVTPFDLLLYENEKNINFNLVYSNLLLRSNRLFKKTKQKLLTKKIQGRPKFIRVPEI